MDSQKESGRSEKKAPGSRVWHMFTPGVLGSLWDRQIRPRIKGARKPSRELENSAACSAAAVQLSSCDEGSGQQSGLQEDLGRYSLLLVSPWPSVLSSETNPGRGLCCGTLSLGATLTLRCFFPHAELPELLLSLPGTACCSPQISSSRLSTRGWDPWDTHSDPRIAWTGADR